ncbi:MAG: M15 family metallopeptidase [Treponema sp.]|nr:M15 family metallopeptidase [Treponema sp.]
MNKRLTAISLIILLVNVYSCGSKQNLIVDETDKNLSVITVQDEPVMLEPIMPEPEILEPEITEPEIVEPTREELIMRALHEAYPDKIRQVEFRNDDWAILLDRSWFYFAEGRMLPEQRKDNAGNYRAMQFYFYPAELPPWTERSPEEVTRFRSWTQSRSQGTLRRSSYFLDALWQAATRAEVESRLVRVVFFGRRIRVHRSIQDILASVETQIRTLGRSNPQVQEWINSIGQVEGYGWRNIADTQARSYHSYGLAVDVLPRTLGRRQTYWLWTSRHREDWWNVSYNERYHPPVPVIKVFEEHGFVWGGKWPLFDTMHFEYRPEILIFNGF